MVGVLQPLPQKREINNLGSLRQYSVLSPVALPAALTVVFFFFFQNSQIKAMPTVGVSVESSPVVALAQWNPLHCAIFPLLKGGSCSCRSTWAPRSERRFLQDTDLSEAVGWGSTLRQHAGGCSATGEGASLQRALRPFQLRRVAQRERRGGFRDLSAG